MSLDFGRKPESYQKRESLVKRFPSARRAKARRARPRGAQPRSRSSKRVPITPALRAYLRKTDEYRAGRDPVALMKQAPAKFARAVAGLSPNQMRKRPARGKWSIVEILGHLQDTEVVYGYRLRFSLAQPGANLEGYDQEAWTERLRHRRGNGRRLVERIRALREGTLDVMGQVPRPRWKRGYGMHSERGKQTVRRTLELIAGHDLNHLDQIKAIRKKFDW